jgi:hypothetical protein
MKRQTIAFDLDGTLIPECGIARLLSTRSLRRDARTLLRALAFQGHRIVIYTLRDQSAVKLKTWFWLQGIPVARVINGKVNAKQLKRAGLPLFNIKVPHLFGIDLLVDDNPAIVAKVREMGTNALLVTSRDTDWTQPIRTLCSPAPQPALTAVAQG